MALQDVIKSQQMLKRDAVNFQPLKATELDGRVRCMYWNFNTTDDLNGGTLAELASIKLARFVAGTRLLWGRTTFEAMGANIKADFGLFGADSSGYISADNSTTADDPDFFTPAQIDVAAAGESALLDLQENNPGYILEKDCWFTVTFEDTSSTNAPAADKDLDGFLLYVVD